jgi:hypothetical protein
MHKEFEKMEENLLCPSLGTTNVICLKGLIENHKIPT